MTKIKLGANIGSNNGNIIRVDIYINISIAFADSIWNKVGSNIKDDVNDCIFSIWSSIHRGNENNFNVISILTQQIIKEQILNGKN